MPGIELNERTTDRGKHLVDLLADGRGRDEAPTISAHVPRKDLDPVMRAIFTLGGVSIALLFTAIVALVLR